MRASCEHDSGRRNGFSPAVERRDVFPELIETERLRLERFDAAVDPQTFYRHAGRSETVAEETTYVTWSPHAHAKESTNVIGAFRDDWENNESATYAVVPRDGENGAGTFAGNTGLAFEWDHRRVIPGIWLRNPFWGRGYSGERAIALARLAFERFGMDVFAVDVLPDNEASVRAIERYVDRLGGRRTGRLRNHAVDDDGTPHDVIRYSVSREEYDAADPDAHVTFHDTLDESALRTE